jgi:hypothetical protein
MHADPDSVDAIVVANDKLADGRDVIDRRCWVAALAAGAAMVVALAATRKSATDGGSADDEELSPEAYARFSFYLGEGKAGDVANDLRSGEMTAAEAEAWSENVQESYQRSHHRRDIEPEEWQKFEDGWRPEGW